MNQEPPISDELYRGLVKVRSGTVPEDGNNLHEPVAGYAAGLEIQYYRGFKTVLHSGLVSGFQSLFFFLPELKFGAVLLGNAGDDNVRTIFPANKIAIELLEEVLKNKTSNDASLFDSETSFVSTGQGERSNGKHEPCPRREHTCAEDIPLHAYTGEYCNPGYHCFEVLKKSGALFIDGTDRSAAFNLRFEPLCNGTSFIAHMVDFWEGGDARLSAEFEIVKGEAVRMGIFFEDALKEYIWFDKIRSDEWADQTVIGSE